MVLFWFLGLGEKESRSIGSDPSASVAVRPESAGSSR